MMRGFKELLCPQERNPSPSQGEAPATFTWRGVRVAARAKASRLRAMTLIELLVSIGVLCILSLALAQLLSMGIATWRSGESRSRVHQRWQSAFDILQRDFAAITTAPVEPVAVYQLDTLANLNEPGGLNITLENLALVESEGVRWLEPADPSREAWAQISLGSHGGNTLINIQPKITLQKSADGSAVCEVKVTAGSVVAAYKSGEHDEIITPNIRTNPSATVKVSIVPLPGKQSNARLFQAAENGPLQPVWRIAFTQNSPGQTQFTAWRDSSGRPCLTFTRREQGLYDVMYYLDAARLYRVQVPTGTAMSSGTPVAIANGVEYFGFEFLNAAGQTQGYWVEADSVPPYARISLALAPLSGTLNRNALNESIDSAATTIAVGNTQPFALGRPDRYYAKIGNEWIHYASHTNTHLVGCQRGVRGTKPAAHTKNAEVITAEATTLEIPIPAWGYRRK